jgi:single-strand DNA-binding protein
MTDINNVIIVGRLTKDVELKYTKSGSALCEVTVANNYSQKKGEEWVNETNFFNVTIFGNLAINTEKSVKKGDQVIVNGVLRQNTWQDKDGENRSAVNIICNNILYNSVNEQEIDNNPCDD